MAISESVVALDATTAQAAVASRRPSAPAAVTRRRWPLTALFTITAFTGAGLLFVVQPLVAKLILPSYGGSATVWSTSSLFFQLLLLLAYGYSHLSTSRLGPAWQPRAHLVLLLLPLVALPLAIPADVAPAADASPVLWLLRTLVVVIGLPFAVIATTGPLLQRWYSWGDGHRSHDPYFLFAASNLGSFGGLLAYPFLIEPHLTLAAQRAWWSAGFLVFMVLTATCALLVRGSVRGAPRRAADSDVPTTRPAAPPAAGPPAEPVARPARRQLLIWTALAFLPSSLMLGVTSHISTDVAAIPLLWVVPLAIYLATFVLAFGRTSRRPPQRVTQWAVAAAFAVTVTSAALEVLPVSLTIAMNLVTLALVAYAAHARLAADRPPAEHLTRFYMVVASGGALGGLLNGLLAPVIFDRVVEYSLVLTVVPLLLIGVREVKEPALVSRLSTSRAATLAIGLVIVGAPFGLREAIKSTPPGPLTVLLILLALAVGWWMAHSPKVMVLALVAFFALGLVNETHGVIERSRTFFGSYAVVDQDGAHGLVHGTTLHGTEFLDAARRDLPTTYYSHAGPLGDAFAGRSRKNVAIVGLGAGTVAAYGQTGQSMTFFEIDPEIVRIARDPHLFHYLNDSPARIRTVVGDGRLGLAAAPDHSFDMIILDAFSSDSVPVHLLTEEAMRTYADKLSPGGVLMVHISNRMFNLEPVLAGDARALRLVAAVGRGQAGANGAAASLWVAMGARDSGVEQLLALPHWRPIGSAQVTWTDDYSSILSVLR